MFNISTLNLAFIFEGSYIYFSTKGFCFLRIPSYHLVKENDKNATALELKSSFL